MRFATMAAGFRYGFEVVYIAVVDGIPTRLVERDFGFPAVAGYDVDESLVIDTSAKHGSRVERSDGVSSGFPLTLRLLDTPAVRSYFARPGAVTWLTADVTATATTIEVASTEGFPDSGNLYLGPETVPYTSKTRTSFTGVTRGTYGKARAHVSGESGALVSDKPLYWRGRKATLLAACVDPYGAPVLTSGGALDTAVVWSGFVGWQGAPSPRRVKAEWELVCEPLDQRLRDKLGAAVTGKAAWSLDANGSLLTDPELVVSITVEADDGTTLDAVSFKPFSADAGAALSQATIRDRVSAGWAATKTSSYLDALVWREVQFPASPLLRGWQATILASTSSSWRFLFVTVGVVGQNFPWEPSYHPQPRRTSTAILPVEPTTNYGELDTPLLLRAAVRSAQLEVVVERGDPAGLPASGWVLLEGDGDVTPLRYVAFDVDDADGLRVRLTLAPGMTPDLLSLATDAQSGESTEVSARFAWGDTGTVADLARRVIESSGRGDNGDYDVNDFRAGYDIEDVDEESFATTFDGPLATMTAALMIDETLSFAELFGGLFALSERAVASRQSADGSAIELTAVRVGLPVGDPAAVTIDEGDLVHGGSGIDAIRPVPARQPPNQITVTVAAGGVEQGPIITNDVHRLRYQGPSSWEVTVHGIDRSVLVGPVATWAEGLFRQSEASQAIEVDVVPWRDVDVGDVVNVELDDVQVWNYATGGPGYSGTARVIGRQVAAASKIMTLTLLLDGLFKARALSPTPLVIAHAGGSTTPTSVDVPREYYPVYSAFTTPFDLLVVEPGDDSGTRTVSVTAVTDTGSACRLTVSGWPSAVSLSRTLVSDGFESDWGGWSEWNDPDDATLWAGPGSKGIVRLSGTTPSSGTGPTSASSGSYYLYFETSGATAGKRGIALGPVFSLADAGAAQVDFNYHMYGASMGTMSLQVSDDDEATWHTVWTLSGDQGNVWHAASVDLADYCGKSRLRLRMLCEGGVGATYYLSDMAWDAISVTATRARLLLPVTGAGAPEGDTYLHTDDTGATWA